jgi:hypothetical protein
MVAPAVLSVIVTVCADVYVPAAIEKVGVAAGTSITNAALATTLPEYPLANAIACTVSEFDTVIAPVYSVDATDGTLPSIV